MNNSLRFKAIHSRSIIPKIFAFKPFLSKSKFCGILDNAGDSRFFVTSCFDIVESLTEITSPG